MAVTKESRALGARRGHATRARQRLAQERGDVAEFAPSTVRMPCSDVCSGRDVARVAAAAAANRGLSAYDWARGGRS